METFSFGFWGWLGKIAAEAAMYGVVLFIVFAVAFGWTLYDQIVKPWRLQRKGICPHCRGTRHEPNTYGCHCIKCSGSGKFVANAIR